MGTEIPGSVGVEREETITPNAIHCRHQNDSCIKMGRGASHFNISLTVEVVGAKSEM